jgi:hypothetical protein
MMVSGNTYLSVKMKKPSGVGVIIVLRAHAHRHDACAFHVIVTFQNLGFIGTCLARNNAGASVPSDQ